VEEKSAPQGKAWLEAVLKELWRVWGLDLSDYRRPALKAMVAGQNCDWPATLAGRRQLN
jgi:hypothetical protein